MCQPASLVHWSRAESSKLKALSCSASSSRLASGSLRVFSGVRGHLYDLPRLDAEAAVAPSAGELHDPLEERRPHVELNLFRDAKPVVQQLGKPVTASRPRLDLEFEPLAVRGAELDLTRLEVSGECHQAKGPRGGAGVPHGRSEEHTSELQSQSNLVCRLLLEKKKKKN